MVQAEIVAIDYKQLYEEGRTKYAGQEALIVSLREENRLLRLSGAKMPDSGFRWLYNLQYRVKDLTSQVRDFKSGERYAKMEEFHKKQIDEMNRKYCKLKLDLADANCQTVTVRKIWEQIVEDLELEYQKALSGKDREINILKNKLLETQILLDGKKDEYRDKCKELYQVKMDLEEERDKNQKLKAQINRNHENSSISSSRKPNHKKIPNGREKTGNKPGGQPGHKWHPRKWREPTRKIDIPVPEEYEDPSRYRPTGKTIAKQLVDIRIEIIVTEYSTPEFRDLRTRQRVHAEFPEGMVNEVTYSGNVKAFAFLLNNRCNVSIANVSDFLSELTDGGLKISTGMICGLSMEFSLKTEAERKKAFADLLLTPVMNADFTTVCVNGKNMNVAVCADSSTAMYFAREHKGHKGVKYTPIEDYQNTLVHDHDVTFYNYGDKHQECNQHPERYLKGVMENEQNRTWAGQMRDLIREMIHFRNSLDIEDNRNPDEIDPGEVEEFEARYDEILKLAKDEYDYEPPGKYNMEGFNLYMRLEKYKASHLLFLHDRRAPPTNNLAERLLRSVKRKAVQMITFRSFDGLDYLCRSMGTVMSIRAQGKNLYNSIASIYDRLLKQ